MLKHDGGGMFRKFTIIGFLFLSSVIFAQQNSSIRIFGRIPNANDDNLYQVQVGAYLVTQNAERSFAQLRGADLNPTYEEYLDFTRVIVGGIRASQVHAYVERIRRIGFSEVLIRVDTLTPVGETAIDVLPISAAALPARSLREIAYRTINIGEQRSLADLVIGRNVQTWTSSTPQTATVDNHGNITGLMLGNAFIRINETEYISIAVVPAEDFFVVPESMAALLSVESRSSFLTRNLTEYRTEPTFRLAYRWNNRGEHRGASGTNGGIDILGRGADYEWLWTTFSQGGWFYDLNGIKREMIDGFQRDANGVELKIYPEFVYDKSVPYLQLRHVLTNTGNLPVSGQHFGASADVMIHNNDFASLILTPYGAYMADSTNNPSLELMFICLFGEEITPVDTLWLGTYMGGAHLNNIYVDRRINVYGEDSAIAFSYQNIDLAGGEAKEFTVRFTLARNEGD